MFTGIVEEVGTLLRFAEDSIVVQAEQVLQDIVIKESIAVDGICLTVIARGEDWFQVDTMPETLRCTRLGSLAPGAPVNLERSLVASGRLGGHMVQGHIEATAPVLALTPDGIGLTVEIELPEQLALLVIVKGFIALNGVSLTVVERHSKRFSVALIPYTREHTNLGQLQVGTLLNLETDIIGRYVMNIAENIVQQQLSVRK
ncbi:MAG: riboflavin synthase [Ktedonobacteraceae bacterium]